MSANKKQAVYAVYMKKRTAKDKNRLFIATDKKAEMGPVVFHGRGVWAAEVPDLSEDGCFVLDTVQMQDVWIPWANIDYVENLTYVGR